MATCRSCHEEIKWGMAFRGRWIALEPEASARGNLVFLPDGQRVMELPARWRSFDDIPSDLAATIPENMRDWWTTLVESPRYRLHSIECQRDVVESVGYSAEKVLG